VQEGVRFAFEGDVNREDDYVLGSRLPFLLLIGKYSNWIKKDRMQLSTVKEFLLTKETKFRSHPEFDDVHEEDLDALTRFKESLGVSVAATPRISSAGDDHSMGESVGAVPTPSPSPTDESPSSRKRASTGGTKKTRMSSQSNLSPVYESDDNISDDFSPQKRRKLLSPQIDEASGDASE